MACITGDNVGCIKIWDIRRAASAELVFSYGVQSRKRGIAAMCWTSYRDCSNVLVSMQDGTVTTLDVKRKMMVDVRQLGVVACTSGGFGTVGDRAVLVGKDGVVSVFPVAQDSQVSGGDHTSVFQRSGPIEACHIHRHFGLVACGGKDNDLCVMDLNAATESVAATTSAEIPATQEGAPVVFRAKNVQDHILGVPHPIYITGCHIVSRSIIVTTTAQHMVRFYDTRVGSRPVQEHTISREITRRPTCIQQWNVNKYLIGEASGDVHLYDTRRGFFSRAKMRGGVGSVRAMFKHPAGLKILSVAGLDRKVRLYHVPTGNMLQSLYVKQMATCCLLDDDTPFADNQEAVDSMVSRRNVAGGGREQIISESVWDDMDPVCEDEDELQPKAAPPAKKKAFATSAGKKKVAAEGKLKKRGREAE